MRYTAMLLLLIAACSEPQTKTGQEGTSLSNTEVKQDTLVDAPRRDTVKYARVNDTLIVSSAAAVYFAPDSATISKNMSDQNFRIGFGDGAFLMHEAGRYLEEVRLPVVNTENEHYIKFIQENGKITLIKTDTLSFFMGIIFFHPVKEPREVENIDNIEVEYNKYFKQ